MAMRLEWQFIRKTRYFKTSSAAHLLVHRNLLHSDCSLVFGSHVGKHVGSKPRSIVTISHIYNSVNRKKDNISWILVQVFLNNMCPSDLRNFERTFIASMVSLFSLYRTKWQKLPRLLGQKCFLGAFLGHTQKKDCTIL